MNIKAKFLYHTCKRILFRSQSIMEKHPARITTGEVTYHIPSSSGLFSTLTWLTMPRFFLFLLPWWFLSPRGNIERCILLSGIVSLSQSNGTKVVVPFSGICPQCEAGRTIGHYTNTIPTHLSRDGITTKRDNVPRKVSKESIKITVQACDPN